jgi:hypothetical protein
VFENFHENQVKFRNQDAIPLHGRFVGRHRDYLPNDVLLDAIALLGWYYLPSKNHAEKSNDV